MAGRPPEPFVSASRLRRRASGRPLTLLFVGIVGVVIAAWMIALILLTLWLIDKL